MTCKTLDQKFTDRTLCNNYYRWQYDNPWIDRLVFWWRFCGTRIYVPFISPLSRNEKISHSFCCCYFVSLLRECVDNARDKCIFGKQKTFQIKKTTAKCWNEMWTANETVNYETIKLNENVALLHHKLSQKLTAHLFQLQNIFLCFSQFSVSFQLVTS